MKTGNSLPAVKHTARQLDIVTDVEFFHQVGAVNVHGFWRQPQLYGDLFHRHALGKFLCHLTLAPGERILPSRRQLDGDIRRQVAAAGGDGAHGGNQLVGATAFREKAARARVERLLDQRRAVVDREHDRRHPFRQLAQQLQPGEIRHRNVADTDLHPAPRQARQRLATGAKLGHDLKIRFEVQKLGKSGANDKVVVDKGDGGHGCSCGLKTPDGAALIRPTRAKDAYLKRSIRKTPQFC